MELVNYLNKIREDIIKTEDPFRALKLITDAYELAYNHYMISNRNLKMMKEVMSGFFTEDYLKRCPKARADLEKIKKRIDISHQSQKKILENLVGLDEGIIMLLEESFPK